MIMYGSKAGSTLLEIMKSIMLTRVVMKTSKKGLHEIITDRQVGLNY